MRRSIGIATAAIVLGVLAGCATQEPAQDHTSGASSSSTLPTASASPDEAAPQGTQPTGSSAGSQLRPVTIAFAGDTHFWGVLQGRLGDPATAMGPLTGQLDKADLAVLNLETAVTTRGAPQPKQFTFRAPPAAFSAVKQGGVDVVTMANNHGLDYGPTSAPDALTAAKDAGMPVIGLGMDEQEAYAPWIATVNGSRVAFLAATAVLDDPLVASWSAAPGHPGLATALDGDNARLVAAVQSARAQADTVVVELHYGRDKITCPTDLQRTLARDLVAAGADVVVGQHAHILLGGGYLGSAYVDYGMGNYQFYSASGPSAQTGVLTLTTTGRQVTAPTWTPGVINGGLPTALSGSAANTAIARWQALSACTGLSATPTS